MPQAMSRGFTLAELIVVMGLIILLIAVGVPSVKAMFSSSTLDSGKKTISASVAAARAFATRQLVLDDGDYMGAAALFMDGQITVVRNTNYNSTSPLFTPMGNVDVVTIDPSIGVAAISRGTNLYLTPMIGSEAFAIRFDADGVLIARRSGGDEYLIDYDSDSDGNATGGADKANIITVIGVIVYDRIALIDAVGSDLVSEASAGDATPPYDWILANGEAMFFNRYSGVVMEP